MIPVFDYVLTPDLNRFVDILFKEERIPYAEGWKRSGEPVTAGLLNKIAAKIGEASNWSPSGGCPWIRLQPEGPARLPGPNVESCLKV